MWSMVLRQTSSDWGFHDFLCQGPSQMECIITSLHSNMRNWPIMMHLRQTDGFVAVSQITLIIASCELPARLTPSIKVVIDKL